MLQTSTLKFLNVGCRRESSIRRDFSPWICVLIAFTENLREFKGYVLLVEFVTLHVLKLVFVEGQGNVVSLRPVNVNLTLYVGRVLRPVLI